MKCEKHGEFDKTWKHMPWVSQPMRCGICHWVHTMGNVPRITLMTKKESMEEIEKELLDKYYA